MYDILAHRLSPKAPGQDAGRYTISTGLLVNIALGRAGQRLRCLHRVLDYIIAVLYGLAGMAWPHTMCLPRGGQQLTYK